MSNFVPILIGSRYSRGRNRNRFGSVVSVFSLVGMAIGVCALILVLSVMNGFNQEISGRLQTLSPHLTVFSSDVGDDTAPLDTFFEDNQSVILAKSPVRESFVMLTSGNQQRPMKLIGVDPVPDASVVSIGEKVIDGDWHALQPGEFGVVLGSYAAASLRVYPGDRINVILPALRMTPVGLFPRQKQFTVVAVFDSGSQLDADYAYAHIEDVSRVVAVPKSGEGWRIKLQDVDLADSLASDANTPGAGLNAQTWTGDYQSLFKAMKMEKVTVGALLLIIVLVAAFNIVSGLIMMVSDKRSDMAVLKTMGASSGVVVRIFLVQGMILGGVGILLGAIIGTILSLYLSDIVLWFERLLGGNLFDPNVFYVSFLPTDWRLTDFLWVVGLASVLCLAATILPAWQAANISPREALNYKQ